MDTKCGCGCQKKCGSWRIFNILLIIGGLNWGLVGVGSFFGGNWNVVDLLLGSWPAVEAVVYVIVGLSAIVSIFGCSCKTCSGSCDSCAIDGGPKNAA